MTDRELLLGLIGSLTLCDNMGDVADDISVVLAHLHMDDLEWNDLSELGTELGKRGITTLYGTPLFEEEDEA